MKLVDLTHIFSIHTPGWVGYPSPKLSYFQRHATNGIVSQYLETPLHAGTHFDGQMRIVSGGKDMASRSTNSRSNRRCEVSKHIEVGHFRTSPGGQFRIRNRPLRSARGAKWRTASVSFRLALLSGRSSNSSSHPTPETSRSSSEPRW
jgi:hypothetical protein